MARTPKDGQGSSGNFSTQRRKNLSACGPRRTLPVRDMHTPHRAEKERAPPRPAILLRAGAADCGRIRPSTCHKPQSISCVGNPSPTRRRAASGDNLLHRLRSYRSISTPARLSRHCQYIAHDVWDPGAVSRPVWSDVKDKAGRSLNGVLMPCRARPATLRA